jgi:GNAT superfamily N-acetyltransferase
MSVAIRHRNDPRPALRAVPGMTVAREHDAVELAVITNRAGDEIRARFADGHRCYVARVDGVAAAWGWVATARAEIGELGLRFTVPAGERYLWNFVTWVPYRGRGIYPVLLDQIVKLHSAEAERFWIVYAPENHASARGIEKAGFTPAAALSFDAQGRVAFHPWETAAAAWSFGAPLSGESLAPCWRCARAGRQWLMTCGAGTCTCDYQETKVGCGVGG